LSFLPFFQAIDQFVRGYIDRYGLAMALLVLSIVVILIVCFQYQNYLQSLKGSPFFLFSGYKTNLKFPFWSSVAVFFGILLALIFKLKANDANDLEIFALGPWMPVLALLNFFIQYLIALAVRLLSIDSLRKCLNLLVVVMVIALIPFSGYYLVFKYPTNDINGWGKEAALLSKPEVCGVVIWGLPKEIAGLRQSQCLDYAAHVSGNLKFCYEIYESSRQAECIDDTDMIANVSADLCADGPDYNFNCVNKYCDMSGFPHAFLADCFFKQGKELNDERWCERIIGEKNEENKDKCFNTVFLAKAKKSMDESWCGRMTGKDIYGQDRDACLSSVDRDAKIFQALASNDEAWCKTIAEADGAGFCQARLLDLRAARKYYEKAKRTADIKECDYLKWFENMNARWRDKWGFSLDSCRTEVKALMAPATN